MVLEDIKPNLQYNLGCTRNFTKGVDSIIIVVYSWVSTIVSTYLAANYNIKKLLFMSDNTTVKDQTAIMF